MHKTQLAREGKSPLDPPKEVTALINSIEMEKRKEIAQGLRKEVKKVMAQMPDEKTVESKRNRVFCKLSKEEREVLKEHVRNTRLKASQYFKMCAFAYMENEYVLPEKIEQNFDKLLFLTGNIANNINQIARKVNFTNKAKSEDLLKVKEEVHKLEEAVEKFIRFPDKI